MIDKQSYQVLLLGGTGAFVCQNGLINEHSLRPIHGTRSRAFRLPPIYKRLTRLISLFSSVVILAAEVCHSNATLYLLLIVH